MKAFRNTRPVSKRKGAPSGMTMAAREAIARTAVARAEIDARISGIRRSKTGVVLGQKRKSVVRRRYLQR